MGRTILARESRDQTSFDVFIGVSIESKKQVRTVGQLIGMPTYRNKTPECAEKLKMYAFLIMLTNRTGHDKSEKEHLRSYPNAIGLLLKQRFNGSLGCSPISPLHLQVDQGAKWSWQ